MDQLTQDARDQVAFWLQDDKRLYAQEEVADYADYALLLCASGKAGSLEAAIKSSIRGRKNAGRPSFPFLVRIGYREESRIGDMRVSRTGTEAGIVCAPNQASAESKAKALYEEKRPGAELMDICTAPADGRLMQELKFFIA